MVAARTTTRGERATPAAWAGLSLLLAPGAQAIEVGDLAPASFLGQPLDASVPLRLAAGESLVAGCVRPVAAEGGLAALSGLTVAIPAATGPADVALRVTGQRPLFEPMYALSLELACPGAPVVVRQFVLMLDLPGTVPATVVAAAAATPAIASTAAPAVPQVAAVPAAPAAPRATPRVAAPIVGGVPYTVRNGDTLFAIARRLEGRTASIWATAEAILAANPAAFVDGNPNRLLAGSTLLLPGTPAAEPGVAPGVAPGIARAGADPATVVADTVDPAVTAAVPAPVASEAPTLPALPAVAAPAPATGTAVFADDLPAAAVNSAAAAAAAAAPPRPVAKAPAATAAPAPAAAEPNPLVAALAGLAFGLVLSGILWSRRVRDALRPAPAAAPAAGRAMADAGATAALPALAFGARTLPEPAITVSYDAADDDALAREFAPPPARPAADSPTLSAATPFGTGRAPTDELTAELEELFNPAPEAASEPTRTARLAPLVPADEPTAASPVLVADDAEPLDLGSLDLDLDATLASSAPAHTITIEQPRPFADGGESGQSPTIDLQALARAANADEGPEARTLREALSLLERDYEEELTASQILDTQAVRAMVDSDRRRG
jgi:pilus assembly protein FimV